MENSGHYDCWYGVEDPAERKKIQNRLSQRKRRRLRQSASRPTSIEQDDDHSDTLMLPQSYFTIPRSPQDVPTVVSVPKSDSISSTCLVMPPSIFAALFTNGEMLGLTCNMVLPHKSSPAGPGIPLSLHPTALQLTTLHNSWIDRWPFPNFRDNAIALQAVFEEEDFLKDLFSMRSFALEEGKPGWDPSGWRIGKDFALKWGFLFY